MNASVLRNTLPPGAPSRLVVLLLLAAVLMALAASLVLEPVLSIPVAAPVETVTSPDIWVGPISAPSPFIDHSVVDWDRVPLESDPSPLAVAAYGN